jgi:hypothetical protein
MHHLFSFQIIHIKIDGFAEMEHVVAQAVSLATCHQVVHL